MNTLPERLQQKIIPEPNSGCWLWLGGLREEGYGNYWLAGHTVLAHRVVYEAIIGPIPLGLQLDHLCRVRCCVNPDHLEPVTPLQNTRRSFVGAAKVAQTHCKRGHEFTAENTRTLMDKCVLVRQCRACDLIRGFNRRRREGRPVR